MLGAKYGAASKPVVIHDYRNAQYNGSLVVGTPSGELTCPMTQVHPICGCPTQIVAMVLMSQFLPRRQIKHLRRQRQHVQDRVRLGSSVRFYSKDTVNIGGVSITDYTSAEVINVSELGISYSLENLTESAAWLDVPLPCSILWTEFVLQWKV